MSTDKNAPRKWTRRTLAAQVLGRIDEPSRALVPPIHVATTYIRDPDNQYRSGNIYGRPDNQTVREAEELIAALERTPWPLPPPRSHVPIATLRKRHDERRQSGARLRQNDTVS